MPAEANFVASVLAVLLQVVALYGVLKLRGTTLVAPCLWAAIGASALLLMSVVEMQDGEGLGLSVTRFAVAAVTLCPLVAVLGAKRPQDRGWQWVVAALWVVLIWPALQSLARPVGPNFEIFLPWKLFIAALIAMGPLNYLPTKHWLAAIFVAAGQALLFGKFLGFELTRDWLVAATFCFLLAASLIAIRCQAQSVSDVLREKTKRWLWFRDAYGAFWGLRIVQRVNETAALRNWPVQLLWTGFEKVNSGLSASVEPSSENPAAVEAEIDQTLDTLLRRFL